MRQELWDARWAVISTANHLMLEDAAAFLGVNKSTVSTYRKRFGFTGPETDIGPIRECAEAGMTRQEAAERLGLAVRQVGTVARQYGLPFRHASAKVSDERVDAMASMFRAGKTLEEIGTLYGITRERVRQLIKKYHGMTGKDGGHLSLVKAKKAKRKADRDAKFLESHGCTFDQYKSVRDLGRAIMEAGCKLSRTPIGAFSNQRENANKRGIEWSLKFWDWWTLWVESGKWELRGRQKGCYVMCRYGDAGPYAIGNVYIASVAHNLSIQPNNPYRKGHPDFEKAMALKVERRHCSVMQAGAA